MSEGAAKPKRDITSFEVPKSVAEQIDEYHSGANYAHVSRSVKIVFLLEEVKAQREEIEQLKTLLNLATEVLKRSVK